jgi:hypothetical protein
MPDLNSEFRDYIVTLKAAATTAKDVTTLVAKDLPNARGSVGGAANLDDLNTLYKAYLAGI